MPRPCKRRRICEKPACERLIPMGNMDGSSGAVGAKDFGCITMALDEYECIRLIDLEGLTQEQCAKQMDVARTTVQAIYGSARAKLAECLVKGKELIIDGGNYVVCDGTFVECPKRQGCCRRQYVPSHTVISRRKQDMRIAVTYENGQIFQHFGHTEAFKIYDVEDNKVTASEVVSTNGSGHGALGGFLADNKVDVLICGGIGGGAVNAVQAAGIQLYAGVAGDADQAVDALLNHTLQASSTSNCDHHGEEHSCGHTCH